MRVANNLPALSAFTSLNSTNKSLQKTINALSTGLRINSASDDAAGFAISEKMRSQIRGLDTAIRNSQDGISLLQTAEGALSQTNSMLQRMRELAVQASNDSLTSNDRQYIQLEIDELKKQIDRIAGTTQFNKKKLLDGSCGALWASSDLNVNVKINGGLTYIDEFGQKVSSEGNYRIDVRAEPGEAQVQKSNIMTISEYGMEVEMVPLTEPITQTVYEIETYTETITEMVTEVIRTPKTETITTTQEVPHIIRINEGVDSINETSGDGWKFEDGSLIITGSGTYDIRGTQGAKAASTPNIIVKSGAEPIIFLTDVHIDKSGTGSYTKAGEAAFQVESGAYASIYLANENSLKSGVGRAGLEVPDGAELFISSADGDGEITGSLKAEGGSRGAGIGGPGTQYSPKKGRAGFIQIIGGTIEAKGNSGGAGIGGGNTNGPDGGGEILIQGGKITALGGSGEAGGAGIGSGFSPNGHLLSLNGKDPILTSDNTSITIEAVESLRAEGGQNSAGIGGACNSSAGNITINKKLIDENRITAVAGGTGAQRIGWGNYGSQAKNYNSYDYDINKNYQNYHTYYEDYEYTTGIPDRPTTEVTVESEQTVYVYEEITTPVEREVTREVTKKVDKIIGERVVDTMPVIKGLNGDDFVFHEKTLGEMSSFKNASGTSLVSRPQTITITQGNGKTTNVTLYETDTMEDVAKKINDAISISLGQGSYTDNPNKFCTIADGSENSSESVYVKEPIYSEEGYLSEYEVDIPAGTLIGYKISSTMLVRSAIPGNAGELYFSGDNELLNALGLNTIRESSETTYTASIYNAHSGKVMANGIRTTGNILSGIIPNTDIEFDSMAGIKSSWDENTKRYVLSGNETYSAYIHLKDNVTAFQTGANKGEDFMIQLSDTSCSAIGISAVNVITRETASRSISIIDRAINKISSQRAKIGSYENALEHTMTNLTTTSMNLTSAESRIRDADMSKFMMDFVKLQILNQSGTSMLAQANQLPQSVLSLLS
ncbi:MAG: hypothetical protein IJR43_09245 [Synergistaceae bacterium]|nr:hypothetical protein [Synergistaceae bacterium]